MQDFGFKQIVCILTIFLLSVAGYSENWPNWRGAANDGVSNEKGLAAEWSAEKNVLWRSDLPGAAASTPAVWGDRIFLTCGAGSDIVLVALNTAGKQLWQRKLSSGNYDIRQGESNPACPSPSTDGKFVWTYTGTGFFTCHDYAGNEIWKIDIQEKYGRFGMYWGMSTTPLLDGDRLYMALMHDNAQLVIAFDKTSGKEIWQHQRTTDARVECLHSYASPVIYRHGNTEQLITHGADYVVAHSLKDGSEIWRCGGLQQAGSYNNYLRFVASPVVGPGLVVVPSAKNGPVLGINPENARGNITDNKDQFHWRMPSNTTDVPSPLVYDGLVYICRENGVLICLDAKSGEKVYQQRVYSRRHRGSPLYADGKIYLMAIDGTVSVIKAGREYELLAQNNLGERSSASLAISDGVIYMRTAKALYAIKK